MSAAKAIVIVGAAETERLGKIPDQSVPALHIDAARRALTDAGVSAGEIDGIASTGYDPLSVAHGLGIRATWLDSTAVGGCSPLTHVRHAAAAIRGGLCHTVLITHGESGRSRVDTAYPQPTSSSVRGQFEYPFGAFLPPTTFTLAVIRMMKETGLTREQLSEVAVVQRRWASMNPRAQLRDPISADDVVASKLIAYPVHLLDCCLVSDGGGALVVTTEERARDLDLAHPIVRVLGTGEAAEVPMFALAEDLTSSRAFRTSGRLAFQEAGIEHADVDHLMLYDAFSFVPIMAMEDLGFVGRGEAATFIAEGNTAPGGALPTNTNGGGLCYAHTGMYGMFAIQESVRQLRGTAPAQVPDVELAVAHGVGGFFQAAATLVLSR
ncbi:thiolase C-terminal domain-containing protein [Mycobacterium sp. 94-17]|uniref:thiolase C-terminal domain-containing protein n=1 Tax=Mycobacterium sp. 94-17 TaxID=2986147 RepID=UPI002D1F682B|nr:thiolase [Mycobacterium sp. 94-17]MEB4209743.1 thiolase [Mycobacterium sp. 94-17]